MLGLASRIPGQTAYPVDVEEEALQVRHLVRVQPQKTSGCIQSRAGEVLVGVEGV